MMAGVEHSDLFLCSGGVPEERSEVKGRSPDPTIAAILSK